jgi:hypothetical protein
MGRFGEDFRLTLITNDPVWAARADAGGVDRIGVDLERLGKAGRQAGKDSRLSNHTIEDLAAIAETVRNADLFVRVNPINADTPDEIEKVLGCGARVLMLPFFRTADEVRTFVRLVDGRAYAMILVETASALVRIREILAVPGIDEVMVGLNDLRLELGVRDHFEVLVSPLLDTVANEVRQVNLPFAVGGVADPNDHSLPVSPDLVLAQFPRLNATGAWLSRSFMNGVLPDHDFGTAISAIRKRLTEWSLSSAESLERARDDLAQRVRARSWAGQLSR